MQNVTATTDRVLTGGTFEANGLVDGLAYHRTVNGQMSLREVANAGGKITRVRLLGERGRYDISYIHATLPNGDRVRVRIGCDCMGLTRGQMKRSFIEWGREAGVFAKGIGLLDETVWSTMDA